MKTAPDSDRAQDIFCPHCGYNLRAIPENRCPECGLGYQHAAIRSLADLDHEQHLATYRGLTYFAAVSLVCSLLQVGWCSYGTFFVNFCIVGVAAVLVAAVNMAASAGSFETTWSVLTKALKTAVLFGLGVFFPAVPLVVAGVWFFLRCIRGGSLPPDFEKADLSLSPRARTRLRRWQVLAWLAIAIAVVALVVAELP